MCPYLYKHHTSVFYHTSTFRGIIRALLQLGLLSHEKIVNILFLLVGELSNLAVEAQKWERIKVEKDGQDYYVFKNPNSDRYLTALGSEKTSDLTITGMIIPYCYSKHKHK